MARVRLLGPALSSLSAFALAFQPPRLVSLRLVSSVLPACRHVGFIRSSCGPLPAVVLRSAQLSHSAEPPGDVVRPPSPVGCVADDGGHRAQVEGPRGRGRVGPRVQGPKGRAHSQATRARADRECIRRRIDQATASASRLGGARGIGGNERRILLQRRPPAVADAAAGRGEAPAGSQRHRADSAINQSQSAHAALGRGLLVGAWSDGAERRRLLLAGLLVEYQSAARARHRDVRARGRWSLHRRHSRVADARGRTRAAADVAEDHREVESPGRREDARRERRRRSDGDRPGRRRSSSSDTRRCRNPRWRLASWPGRATESHVCRSVSRSRPQRRPRRHDDESRRAGRRGARHAAIDDGRQTQRRLASAPAPAATCVPLAGGPHQHDLVTGAAIAHQLADTLGHAPAAPTAPAAAATSIPRCLPGPPSRCCFSPLQLVARAPAHARRWCFVHARARVPRVAPNVQSVPSARWAQPRCSCRCSPCGSCCFLLRFLDATLPADLAHPPHPHPTPQLNSGGFVCTTPSTR